MAATAHWFGRSLGSSLGGYALGDSYRTDWLSDTIKVALFTSATPPDQDFSPPTYTDIALVMTEVSDAGTGYTTGGETLVNKTMAYTDVTHLTVMDADNVTWLGVSLTCRYALVYNDTDPGKMALAYYDFGEDKGVISGTFTVDWDATGILQTTAG